MQFTTHYFDFNSKKKNYEKNLVYFATPVTDKSDTNGTSATGVRHEQHKCDTSATPITRVRYK